MLKVDINATMTELRAVMERSAAIPGQDACELACNRYGIDASVAFARWSFEQKDRLDPDQYVDAVGMLLGSMLVGSLSAIDREDFEPALHSIFNQLAGSVNRHMAGIIADGDATVQGVTRDVGDA